MNHQITKAALYIRVSTEEQANQGQSVDAQIETLTQYCRLYDIEVHDIYKDLGISGKDTRNRPALKTMLHDAAAGKFNMVLVWKISRLSRSLKDLLIILDELEKCNVVFGSYSEKFDTSTPVGRMTLQLLGSIAEFERNTIVDNVKLGLKEYARKGGKTGTVLGYDNIGKQLVANYSEAEIVGSIFHLYTIDRFSLSQIANHLNQRGCKTKRGNEFNKDSVSVILNNPVYIGINRHLTDTPEEYTTPGVHQPIITKEIWDTAQAIKESNKQKRSKRKPVSSFLLSGKVICPCCSGTMHGFTTKAGGKQYEYYKCKECGRLCHTAKIEAAFMKYFKDILLEEKIIESVLQHINSSYFSNNKVTNSFFIEQDIAQCQKMLHKYIRLLENKDFTESETIFSRIQELELKLKDLKLKQKDASLNQQYCNAHLSISNEVYCEAINKLFYFEDKTALHQIIQFAVKSIHLADDNLLQSVTLNFVL